MRRAFVMIDVEKGQSNSVAAEICKLPGIISVDVVFGEHNLIAVIEAEDIDQLARIVRERIATAEFVFRTQTLPVIH